MWRQFFAYLFVFLVGVVSIGQAHFFRVDAILGVFPVGAVGFAAVPVLLFVLGMALARHLSKREAVRPGTAVVSFLAPLVVCSIMHDQLVVEATPYGEAVIVGLFRSDDCCVGAENDRECVQGLGSEDELDECWGKLERLIFRLVLALVYASTLAGFGFLLSVLFVPRKYSVPGAGQRDAGARILREHAAGQLFVSYSREDEEFALELAKGLRAAGMSVWMDQLDIPKGARWDRAVEAALSSASAILAIFSPASVVSENVLDELGYGMDHGIRIVPFLFRECEIPLRLRRLQRVDFTGSFEEALEELLEVLRQPEAQAT